MEFSDFLSKQNRPRWQTLSTKSNEEVESINVKLSSQSSHSSNYISNLCDILEVHIAVLDERLKPN